MPHHQHFPGPLPGLVLMLSLALSAGCVHAPLNQPAAPSKTENTSANTSALTAAPEEKTSDLAVFLFFSGGGKRASALSYGVLKELAGVTALIDGRQQRLLDRVEFISSVSGGSFTAAYYCLFKDRIFEDYEARYLKPNTNRALILRLVNPFWWPALWSPYYARGDLAAHYYDQHIFDGATFGDLARAGNKPLLFINATDVASGQQIPFSQAGFSLLATDLDKYPVARAVAASSAVPVLLTPITLKNYSDPRQPANPPAWTSEPQDDPNPLFAAKRQELQKARETFTNPQKYPYIHLVDGGLSDNLGLHSLVNACVISGGLDEFMTRMNLSHPQKLLVIVVNAAAYRGSELSRQNKTPGAFKTMTLLGDSRGGQENARALEYARAVFSEDRRAKKTAPGARRHPIPKLYMVTVDFDHVADPDERAYLQNLPTSFNLPGKAIDRLAEAGARLLRESPEFQRLLQSLAGEAANN